MDEPRGLKNYAIYSKTVTIDYFAKKIARVLGGQSLALAANNKWRFWLQIIDICKPQQSSSDFIFCFDFTFSSIGRR
jgi:hypothetical protein